jgi:hypothetical protein
MDQNQQNSSGNIPNNSEAFGNVRNDSESFRTVPNHSETFGTVPNDAEPFRTVPKLSERKENHTLTVRDAARMFEAAGVARTERSIVNWCRPTPTGMARLDSYFDLNERKYYVTPESVERAIQEEIQKATRINDRSESFGTVPKPSETPKTTSESDEKDSGRIREIERELIDLKIANRGKDYLIEQLQKERNGFFDQLLSASRKVGELETRLLQLEEPKSNSMTQ